MSNIILGIIIVIVNLSLAIQIGLEWGTLIGVFPGAALFGWGLHEYMTREEK